MTLHLDKFNRQLATVNVVMTTLFSTTWMYSTDYVEYIHNICDKYMYICIWKIYTHFKQHSSTKSVSTDCPPLDHAPLPPPLTLTTYLPFPGETIKCLNQNKNYIDLFLTQWEQVTYLYIQNM